MSKGTDSGTWKSCPPAETQAECLERELLVWLQVPRSKRRRGNDEVGSMSLRG